MNHADYLAAAGVSSHGLADFKRSPQLYLRCGIMKLPRPPLPQYALEAMRIGTATHVLTLEGEAAFEARYALRPDGTDGRTKEGKAVLAALKESGREIIDQEDAERVHTMARRVRGNPHAARLLATGAPEVARFAKHAPTQLDLKGKADWHEGSYGCDLKTCRDLNGFAADVETFGYSDQAAFYRALFGWRSVYLIAVESQEPYRVGVFHLTDRTLDAAHARNEAALADMARCYALDEWPGDPADVIDLDIPALAG